MASKTKAEDPYLYKGKGEHNSDRIALVVSKWHPEITEELYKGAIKTLRKHGVEFTLRQDVPGTYELPLGAKLLAETRRFDAIICLGVVVKGETRHDEYINHAVADNLMRISVKHRLPVLFGVLTTETLDQALQRAGGSHGHKGKECAVAALELIDLVRGAANL